MLRRKLKKEYQPKILEQIARESVEINAKQLKMELVYKMINAYLFIYRNLKIGSKFNLNSHNINHANSILSVLSFYTDIGITTRYILKVLKEVANNYTRLISQYKFKYHTYF